MEKWHIADSTLAALVLLRKTYAASAKYTMHFEILSNITIPLLGEEKLKIT